MLLAMYPAGVAFLPGLGAAQLFVLLVPVIVLGYCIPVLGMWKMYRASITKPIDQATQYMKDICHYNQWQASGIMGLMAVTGILFFSAIL